MAGNVEPSLRIDDIRMLLTKEITRAIYGKVGRRNMGELPLASYVAFEGDRRVAAGNPAEVVRAVKERLDRRKGASILIFNATTGAHIDIDLRSGVDDVLAHLAGSAGPLGTAECASPSLPRGPGRPKLGVVAREVTLLPRHWEWLSQQPGGASVALRRLVEEARRGGEDGDIVRRARDASYRFMTAMAGDRPNYEEAIRALFANESARFNELVAGWPVDVRDCALMLAGNAFHQQTKVGSS
jgi:uncharacterized protein